MGKRRILPECLHLITTEGRGCQRQHLLCTPVFSFPSQVCLSRPWQQVRFKGTDTRVQAYWDICLCDGGWPSPPAMLVFCIVIQGHLGSAALQLLTWPERLHRKPGPPRRETWHNQESSPQPGAAVLAGDKRECSPAHLEDASLGEAR